MTDISAAIGIVQLKKLDKFNLRRRKNAEYYTANLTAKGLVKPVVSDNVSHVYHQYVVRLTEAFPLSWTAFMDYLKGKGIGSAGTLSYTYPPAAPICTGCRTRYVPGSDTACRFRAFPAGTPITGYKRSCVCLRNSKQGEITWMSGL